MSEQTNRIGQDFTTLELFKFALPAFFMNLFSQLFKSLDDALFISKFVGEIALAGLNLTMPLFCVQMAFSHMFSLGSANISAKYMGQNRQLEAKRNFTRIIIAAAFVGGLIALICNVFSTPILKALGADTTLAYYALIHIRFVITITPITIINSVFSAYFSTAGKPKMGMICSLVNGTVNILLDLILVAYLGIGVVGAGIATVGGEVIVFIIGLLFFCNHNNEIYFVNPEGKYLYATIKSCTYSLPQFVNSCSIGFTSLYTNKILLSLIGSNGVAANAIINDIRAIMTAGLIGIAQSCAPVISFNVGNKNPQKLKRILISIFKIWILGSIFLMAVCYITRKGMVRMFMNENSTDQFYNLALFGLTIEILSIPFTSACVTISRILISITETKMALYLSIFRNLIVRVFFLTVMPILLKTTGIWLAFPIAEATAFMFGSLLLFINRDNYGYGKSGKAYKLQNNETYCYKKQ